MKFLVVLSMLVVVSRAVVFRDCKSEGATVSSVTISGCDDDAEECTFLQGSKYDVSITFTPNSMPHSLKVIVTALTYTYQTHLAIDHPDVCDVVSGCPLTEGTEYTYTSTFYYSGVDNVAEPVTLYFQFFPYGEDQGDGFLCVAVKGQVEKQE